MVDHSGSQWDQRCQFLICWGCFWNRFSLHVILISMTPQNQDFGVPYNTFWRFGHSKNTHFATPFRCTFRPHFWTPLWTAFWTNLGPRGADLASPCRFWSFLRTPWVPKWGLVAPKGSLKPCTKGVLEATRVAKASREQFLSILGSPLGAQGALLGPPWVPKAPFLGPPWVPKATFWDP